MADETKSPEIEAIEKVADQVKDFSKQLGDRADKKEVKEVKDTLEDLKKNIGKLTEKEIDERLDKINKANEKLHKQMEEMAEDVAKAKEGGQGRQKFELFDPAEVKGFVDKTFKDGRKTGEQATIKLNSAMIFKAAEIFGYPTFFEGAANTQIDAFTGRFVDPTLYQRKRKRNLILDNFSIETIGVPKLIYLEKHENSGDDGSNTDPGGADWIVSGQIKPMRSFRVGTGEVEAKKLAIFGTIEDKLLKDVPSLENWLREDFMQEMAETYNDGVLNNNPGVNADAPLGLKQNAIQYAVTPAFTTNILDPNYIDAIIAAAAYMATLRETPEKAFVSADVYYAIHVLKDSQGRYQNSGLVYVNSLGQLYVGGIQIVISDQDDIPSTHLLMTAAPVGFKIKNYGPLVFERGLNGEDFRYDRTSYRGYQEVLTYIPSHRYNTVLYDTFANIFTAIALPG